MKQKKIICFDMDGTLINSFPAHAKAFNKAFKANKLPEQSESDLMKLFGLEAKVIIKKFFPKISIRKLEVCVDDQRKFLQEETYVHTRSIDGAMEALKKLKKEWKLALVSGTFKSGEQLLLKEGGIDQRIFDVVIGGDEVKHEKPSPDLIKKAGTILESEVTWMVGDTIWDVKAGKAAKVRTVAVLTGKTPIEELVKADPTMIIQSVYMLPEALKA